LHTNPKSQIHLFRAEVRDHLNGALPREHQECVEAKKDAHGQEYSDGQQKGDEGKEVRACTRM